MESPVTLVIPPASCSHLVPDELWISEYRRKSQDLIRWVPIFEEGRSRMREGFSDRNTWVAETDTGLYESQFCKCYWMLLYLESSYGEVRNSVSERLASLRLPADLVKTFPVIDLLGTGLCGHGIPWMIRSVEWLVEINEPVDDRLRSILLRCSKATGIPQKTRQKADAILNGRRPPE